MAGQKEGQIGLRAAREARDWTKDDIVVGLVELASELSEQSPRVDANLVGKWERGDRNPGKYYAPRLCVLLDVEPEALGFNPRPRLLTSIRELRARATRYRHTAIRSALAAGALGASADVEWGRLGGLVPQEEPRRPQDLERLAKLYASELDTVAPVALMPQVYNLLRYEQKLARVGMNSQIAAAACNTAIVAGWLSYNVHNRGDANAFWSYASDLAKQASSGQLQAYVLGIRSCLYSAVPKRGETWQDATLPITLLDHAISLSKGVPSPPLRAWLFARRAEEHAASGNHSGALRDISTAYSLLGRQLPSGRSNDIPILDAWRDARLARYHGSTMQLLGNYGEAEQTLRVTLDTLDPSFTPQRAMAMTDLATVYTQAKQPQPDMAASLLAQALELAQQSGLIEATMRVAAARHHLNPWRTEPFVRYLDDQLRLI